MLSGQQTQLISHIESAVRAVLPDAQPAISLERPKIAAHGDIACNAAMQLAKAARRNPRELAQQIVERLQADAAVGELVEAIEIAGPGFINFRLAPAAHQAVLHAITEQGERFGHVAPTGRKLMVEFVSANPTAPLHVGRARQAALGDALCRLSTALRDDGRRVSYTSDAGNPIANLPVSVQARERGIDPGSPDFPADGYKGDYVRDIARDFQAGATVQAADGASVTASGNIDSLEDI